MAITWPAKNNYATGDVLTAANMNGIGDDLNALFDNSFYAGKNKIINGDFGIWQRGTSFSGITGGQYTADRWCGNYINGTVNVTQQSFTAGTAPVSGYEGTYFLQLARTSTHASIADYFTQRIEDARTFANQTVTFSFWAKVSTGTATIGTYFTQSFGSGGSSETGIAGNTFSLTTSWQRFSTTHTFASVSGKTIGTGSWIAAQFVLPVAEGNKTWQIWGVQLEAGSTASPFQTATGTKQGELAACQRYYTRFIAGAAYMTYGLGNASGTTNAYIPIQFPVQMRTNPSSVEYSGLGLAVAGVGSVISASSVALEGTGYSTIRQTLAVGATGLVTSTYYSLISNNNSSAYLGFSAEL